MSKYVLSFRSQPERVTDADEEAAWGVWFGQIGSGVVDFGNRVGQVSTLGTSGADSDPRPTVLSGYIVVS